MAQADTINNRLLGQSTLSGPAQEQLAGRRLREDRIGGADEEKSKKEVFKKTAIAAGKIAQEHSISEAVKQGVSVGLMLRKEISEGRFSGATFIVVIILSLFKDFVDIGTLGSIGWIINIAVILILFIALYGNRAILKRFFLRIIITIIAESIPFLSILPIYTVVAIWIKMSADQKTKALEFQLAETEKETERLQKMK